MRVWRVVARHRVDEAWSPPRMDHRWTSRRSHVVYAALEPGLAVAEKLAHVRTVDQLEGFVLAEGEFSGDIDSLDDLPHGWGTWPHRADVQRVGDAWAQARSAPGLDVPSVLLPARNLVLNQEHPGLMLRSVATHDLDRFQR